MYIKVISLKEALCNKIINLKSEYAKYNPTKLQPKQVNYLLKYIFLKLQKYM